uniref:Secreted protein n=1 Tax=Macrostomum lignano TaxID=282301 RepID=A0A1I8FJP3_9PLAT
MSKLPRISTTKWFIMSSPRIFKSSLDSRTLLFIDILRDYNTSAYFTVTDKASESLCPWQWWRTWPPTCCQLYWITETSICGAQAKTGRHKTCTQTRQSNAQARDRKLFLQSLRN